MPLSTITCPRCGNPEAHQDIDEMYCKKCGYAAGSNHETGKIEEKKTFGVYILESPSSGYEWNSITKPVTPGLVKAFKNRLKELKNGVGYLAFWNSTTREVVALVGEYFE
jgi:ribosomal protein L37E